MKIQTDARTMEAAQRAANPKGTGPAARPRPQNAAPDEDALSARTDRGERVSSLRDRLAAEGLAVRQTSTADQLVASVAEGIASGVNANLFNFRGQNPQEAAYALLA